MELIKKIQCVFVLMNVDSKFVDDILDFSEVLAVLGNDEFTKKFIFYMLNNSVKEGAAYTNLLKRLSGKFNNPLKIRDMVGEIFENN